MGDHIQYAFITVWVIVVILSGLLFARNYVVISKDVSLCNALYRASREGDDDKYETAVVARDGKVLKPTRLIDASNIEGSRFKDKDVLIRLKERSATGGGYLDVYDCHDRRLRAKTVYVDTDRKGNFRVTSEV